MERKKPREKRRRRKPEEEDYKSFFIVLEGENLRHFAATHDLLICHSDEMSEEETLNTIINTGLREFIALIENLENGECEFKQYLHHC